MERSLLIGLIVLAVIIILSFLIALFVFTLPKDGGISLTGENVQVIEIKGPIQAEKTASILGGTKVAASTVLVEELKKAKDNPSIKAVVLEINSPGGTVVASKEIGNAIKELKKEKPTVAWIREVGASGGYWIASCTDWIVADELSVTGSIGVVGSILSFEGLLDRYNITYQQLISGKYKDAGSPFRDMTPQETALFQERLDIIHDAFIREVSNNRNIEYNKVKEMATGMFYLGGQAKNLGLVDELGGKTEVENYMKKRLNAEKINFIQKKKTVGLFDILTQGMSEASFNMGRGLAYELKQTRVSNEVQLLI
ncbi:signal peptide peptidase SppA [Candidatus Woesearchaeota archaeon]|nr:signal peptide peptidase SppA [Candidatus Woesearchaeota archaeon]